MALPTYDERERRDGPDLQRASLSGLTEAEAREFHRFFVFSFLAFLLVAIIAHVLTYIAMPWGLHP